MRWVLHLHFDHSGSEAKDYGILALINIVGSLGEFIIASYLALSVSAWADAIHALSHSFTFAAAAYTIWAVRRYGINENKAKSIRNKLGGFFLILTFFTLFYIAYSAYNKLSGPVATVSGWMFFAGCIGVTTSLISLLILHGMQDAHSIRDAMHSIISADTILDLSTSFAVIVGAILHSFGIERIDPILALFFIAPLIAWRLGYIFWKEILQN